MKRLTQWDLFHFECQECGYVHTFTKKSDLVIRLTCICGATVRLNDDTEVDIRYED